jgi:hypothetical protein
VQPLEHAVFSNRLRINRQFGDQTISELGWSPASTRP